MTAISAARACAIFAFAATMLAFSWGGTAHAITDTIFQYKTPKTGYFSISPEALAPENADGAKVYLNGLSSVRPTQGNAVCMVTGVNLPDGALIKSVTAWVSSDIDRGVLVAMYRSNPATGDLLALSIVEPHDATQTRVAISDAPATAVRTVNNQHFNYAVAICLETSNSQFYGARITYTYTNAGD